MSIGEHWSVDGYNDIVCNGETLFSIINASSDEINKAIAAPNLLVALEAAMAFIDSHSADPDITAEMSEKYAALQAANPQAAIAKARGES